MKRIIVSDTGTEYGYTTISQLAYGCPRKAYLSKFSGNKKTNDINLLTGSAGHALLAEHYKGNLEEVDLGNVELADADGVPFHREATNIAKNVFMHYRARYDPRELGKVLGVETYLEHGTKTCRLDLLVRVTKREVKWIAKTRGVELTPGVYIVDHKVLGFDSPNQLNQQRYSLQFSYYALIAKQLGYKIEGTLVNCLFKTNPPRFTTIHIPRVGALETQLVDDMYSAATEYLPLTEHTKTKTNPKRCFDWNRTCKFWLYGQCKRI